MVGWLAGMFLWFIWAVGIEVRLELVGWDVFSAAMGAADFGHGAANAVHGELIFFDGSKAEVARLQHETFG